MKTLHDQFAMASIDEWERALQNAAATKNPEFPGFTHFARLGSANLSEGITEAFKLYRIARPHLDDCVGANKVYMDFGCGVGRILKTYMRDFAPENMIGLDVDKELIRYLQQRSSRGLPVSADFDSPSLSVVCAEC